MSEYQFAYVVILSQKNSASGCRFGK